MAARVETEYRLITPTIAKAFLEKNHPNNRTVSESLVDRYAADMVADRWVLTHQGLAFSTDGYMIDGQHRCLAVLKANKAVRMAITIGLPPVAIEGIDLNRPRRTSDVLEISAKLPEGINAQTTVSRTVVLYRLMEPKIAKGGVNTREFDQVWTRYQTDLIWAAREYPGGVNGGGIKRKIRSAPVMGAIVASHAKKPKLTEAFMAKVDTGLEIARNDEPAASLRRYLDGIDSLYGEGRMAITYATLRACYAAIHDQTISTYRPAVLTRSNPEFQKVLRFFGFTVEEAAE